MPHTRTTLALIAAAVTALGTPSVAQAGALHDHHASDKRIPRVIVPRSLKRLPVAKAKALQVRAQATGRYPAPPRLASNKGLANGTTPKVISHRAPISTGATALPLVKGRPSTVDPKIFGYQGTYDAKKWTLVNWVNYSFANVLGRSFRQPHVYEVGPNGTTPTGCGAVANAMFCGGSGNTAAFSSTWSRSVFDGFGDAAFASVMAHEYGHGAMWWLGFGGRGWFVKQIYREGFADCMAGAWLSWMAYYRYTDAIGRGDRAELNDIMGTLGASNRVTTYDNHGDAAWRTALSTYGWNTGFNGCIAWGRQLAAA